MGEDLGRAEQPQAARGKSFGSPQLSIRFASEANRISLGERMTRPRGEPAGPRFRKSIFCDFKLFKPFSD